MSRFVRHLCQIFALLTLISCVSASRKPTNQILANVHNYFTLTTGNGFGFELFDAQKNKLIAFQDHAYRFLQPNPDITKDGPERRNLLRDFKVGFIGQEKINWLENEPTPSVRYLDESNIIQSTAQAASGTIESYIFSPFELKENAFVALSHSAGEHVSQSVHHLDFHLGASPLAKTFFEAPLNIVEVGGEKIVKKSFNGQTVWIETSHGKGALVYIPVNALATGECDSSCEGPNVTLEIKQTLQGGWSGLLVGYIEDTAHLNDHVTNLLKYINKRSSEGLLSSARGEWNRWRKPIPIALPSENDTQLWRQSEAVLRMAQIEEPNQKSPHKSSYGMILASLAPGSWATGWVRDGTYSTVALARSGHFAEAKKSLNFFLNAEPVGTFKSYLDNSPYRISVTRYYGNGAEEADYSTQKTPNVETDGWGLFLWAARQYVQASGDTHWLNEPTRDGLVYEAMRDGVAKVIEAQLQSQPKIMRPDSSIWEVHVERNKHFIFTSLTAARGLCDFAAIAGRSGHTQDQAHFAELSAQIKRDLQVAFKMPEGYLVGAIERHPDTDLDAALTELYALDVLTDVHSPLTTVTLDHLQGLKLASGGYKRTGGSTDYEITEWPFIDFRMANIYYRLGDRAQGDAMMNRILERAHKNYNLIPEEYNTVPALGPLGAYAGSTPMVGYGSGAFILSAFDRAGQYAPHECR